MEKNKSNEIYVEGTDEQIGLAEKLIHEKLEKLNEHEEKLNEHEETIDIPHQIVGSIVGKNGRMKKHIQAQSGAKITILKEDECSVVKITGSPNSRKEAYLQIMSIVQDKKKAEGHKKDVVVPKEYIGIIIGKGGKNLKMLETKSVTKIRLINESGVFRICGSPTNCNRASALITKNIIAFKEHISKKNVGGDKHFAYFYRNYDHAEFMLKRHDNAPKLDGFIKGHLHRIEIEPQNNVEKEFSMATVSSIEDILLTSLRHLHQKKDEEQLKIDLWCHFGKVFVHNVDEAEEESRFTVDGIARRLGCISNKPCEEVQPINDIPEEDDSESDHWRATFVEGIDRSKINDGILEDEILEHLHTLWRYDYEFSTPSDRCVRLKLWEGLRDMEPPSEVKNLLKQVFLEHHGEDLVAWLCYPSRTMVRGEIMTPCSKYDCRLKLRTGRRTALEETTTAEEEDKILSDYLSKCTLDRTNHRLNLPSSSDLPEGFQCNFHRAAKEEIFSCDGEENEKFTIIVLDEEGWDSDSSKKRVRKQLGIRVVLDSWSHALLSGQWEPEKIVRKLPNFMEFLQDFQGLLFD